MSSITIKEVTTSKELKQFIKFPFTLFKGNDYWVPPLISDELGTLSRDKNPAFDYCEAKYFLAYRNGKIVGRIAGIINTRSNEIWNTKNVRFGWIDFVDDIEVARALLSAVEKWGKSKGMTLIHGPLGFTDMDPEGMLVDGFDKLPTIANLYNYPHYPQHLEALGYKGAEDWLQLKFNASQPVPEKVERINKLLLEKYKLRISNFKRKKDIMPYARSFFETLNLAFSNLYGFAPLTDKEIERYIKQYFTFIRLDLLCFLIDENDKVVGFGISMPSLSGAFRKARGRLFPFGFIHVLRALKKYDSIDLYLNGVHPDWQSRGIHSIYYTELNKAYIRLGVKTAISNQQLESNHNAISVWKNYDAEPYLRRRCYEKHL